LGETRRVLVIGAHPDDEDTGLLTYVARGYGADAAYLALSRGDGGQNLIGDELGVDLGLLRSRELEAARAVDGAHQFFSRAFDFGYSRSVDETASLWLADSVLKDVVRVVRRFKPHVVVSVFSGTSRDGHGQHQLAGLMAGRAFETAGDPSRFPELQSEEGLDPWTPLKLYRSTRFDANSTTLRLATGELDPRSGRSYNQIAMESRSQHRSQDMGRLQPIGPAWARLRLDQDRTETGGGQSGQGVFAGISRDESWLTRLADSVRNTVSASRLHEAAVPLARALAVAPSSGSDPERHRLLEQAVAVSAGLVIDGRTTIGRVVPGQRFTVTVELYNAGPYEVSPVTLAVIAPQGWRVALDSGTLSRVEPGGELTAQFTVTVPADVELTQPYFLQRPLIGALYDWSTAESQVRGLPFEPPPVRARVTATVLGAELTLEREITYQTSSSHLAESSGRPVRSNTRLSQSQ
jgi:LmbE family N-acetylglucosaminyl deacetylase